MLSKLIILMYFSFLALLITLSLSHPFSLPLTLSLSLSVAISLINSNLFSIFLVTTVKGSCNLFVCHVNKALLLLIIIIIIIIIIREPFVT